MSTRRAQTRRWTWCARALHVLVVPEMQQDVQRFRAHDLFYLLSDPSLSRLFVFDLPVLRPKPLLKTAD